MPSSAPDGVGNARMSTGRPQGEASRKGIQDVARQLGVTQRTLRFYEDKGLIDPERVGSTRIYSRRDIGRMQLILRGKRLGFSIREIKEFLDLYDVDSEQAEQMGRLLGRVRERLADLEKQRKALEETIRELKWIEQEAMARLKQHGPPVASPSDSKASPADHSSSK